MSGFVGTFGPSAPPDRALLGRLTEAMAFRGPDAREIRIEGPAGLGHAMLRTAPGAEGERQPATLDGRAWIVADARVDGRDELIDALAARGRPGCAEATDAELILHAYHAWGDDCPAHLLGDFAFAIWDGGRRRLFCARDHLGVKPLFYAQLGDGLLVGNTLDCLRRHPAVSGELNEQAVADFLLFWWNQDPATTVFADIQRVPPAHRLVWDSGGLRVSRYWELAIGEEIRYRRSRDYVERFQELLRRAVADRLRTDRVAVLMSGGLDSTAVAATARALPGPCGRPVDVRAHTMVYDRVLPDRERHYAGLAAAALGIPIEYLPADDHAPYERWDRLAPPEPTDNSLLALMVDCLGRAAADARVALTGWDGDAFFSEDPKPYLADLLRRRRFGRLAQAAWQYTRTQRALPPVGLRTTLNRLTGRTPRPRPFPPWLNQAFAMRLGLAARWQRLGAGQARHPVRPRGVRGVTAPDHATLFEDFDAGVTGLPLEVRHPLCDLRLIGYALAIPAVPWCVDKELIRQAMRGILPESVRRRPKAPLAGDPVVECLGPGWATRAEFFDPTDALAKYVDVDAVHRDAAEGIRAGRAMSTLPASLNHWLRYSSRAPRRRS